MKTGKILPLLTIICFAFMNMKAQKTGSFDDTISFMASDRKLSCYVPGDYDPGTNYRLMICLHGLGDNSANFRNALINSLNWPVIFTNTIFICPDGGDDVNRDFYAPAGDEQVIEECIGYARKNYSIDTNNIILEGFSLGGRSALKYGLDFPEKFKGLLLNTPAIQGLADAINDPNGGVIYNYANASLIPIYISIGGEDDIYVYNLVKTLELMKKNDAVVTVEEVSGVGHTIPARKYIEPCLQFFENPATAPYDVDIFQIELPQRSCSQSITPACYIRNIGSNRVTSVEIDYEIGGNNGTYTWTGDLGLYEHAYVTLPQLNVDTGSHSLDLEIGTIGTGITDTMEENNTLSKTIEIVTEGKTYPVFEGFEGDMEGWIFEETGSVFAWFTDDNVKKDGNYSISAFNTILMFYTGGYVESFMSPVVDLTSVSNPKMTFDLAYNYHKYTPPYFTQGVFFADTLEVSISTDCGQTYETLFKKGGADLATTSSPIVNPLNLQQCFFRPNKNEWRMEIIDLGAYSAYDRTIIKFSYISALGGSINIDNVHFTNNPVSVPEEKELADFKIYPNPAKDILTIEPGDAGQAQVKIYDVTGKVVLQTKMEENSRTIDVSSLQNGFYNVEVISNKTRTGKKLLIRK